jgi:acyl-CoA reductase-like NAD-dependent aldehyde dehydrogenase
MAVNELSVEPAAAVAEARAAFAVWGATPVRERAAALARLRREVVRRADDIVAVVSDETGKPAADVVMAEVMHAAAHADWLARSAPRLLATRRASPRPVWTKQAWLAHRPRGVAAVIAPWNYPFLLPFLPTATALAAGCAVVLKPSEVAPRSGALVSDVVASAGLPAGVVRVVQGGADVGERLVAADVDVVAVTGSTATGRAVARAAAERLTPVVAELGGKDAVVVLADADLRRAARATVWGACFNAGQSCVSIERVYVEAAAHDAFVAEVERALDDVTADGDDRRRDVGPMIGPRQADVVLAQIADAVAHGATLRRGGRRIDTGGRTRIEPALLTGVHPGMAVVRDETFGPVIPVAAVPDEDAAVAAVNDCAFALGASVWSRDRARARQLAARLRAGAVAINDVAVNYGMPQLPFGGTGASGAGRQGGAEGLLAYTVTQSITDSWLRPPRELQWFPRTLGERGWRRLVRALYGR